MKIKVADFMQQIDGQNYQNDVLPAVDAVEKITEQKLTEILQPLFEHFAKLIAAEKLGRIEQPVNFVGQVVTIALETGVINLPFANNNHVDNFFDSDTETEVLANLVVTSPKLNASGLRIDTLGEITQWTEQQQQQAVKMFEADLKQLVKNVAD
ncbi:MAG: hypothetical protein LKJ22_06140 [Liquorilactobacillus nagelii]|jgi:hypothetical protein|uniref:hypothetical protein n=1 Tax=Liquorilactobacillus nagelii TaxID=82688 RepID=UPI002432F54B|nr:hypothetical protein [Liquorilactobacillus nagelii]MCI1921493.1 hypothetical protein [Liquorilactobacillus nagelii]MCI1976663.1 hypothetical protein [Liquorilactobacillus nagelii]